MKHGTFVNDSVSPAESGHAEMAHDSADTRIPYSDRWRILSARSTAATMALITGLTALSLNGCATRSDEPTEMDTVLVSDLLIYYRDGEKELRRHGRSSCYGGLCLVTDGKSSLPPLLPEDFVFAGHHDEYISAHEGTIEDRNGIMIGDISLGEKVLPDIPGVAVDRTITGYGGWGKYVGFDALNYDYVRDDREQRMVWATLGGYRSKGNPIDGVLTWTGAAVGIDHSDPTKHLVLVGDSKLTVYPDEDVEDVYLVDVDITDWELKPTRNMMDVETGKEYADMFWRWIPLRDGGFRTFEIQGHFFGPDHEEVGGVFDRDNIAGAFGGTRAEQ